MRAASSGARSAGFTAACLLADAGAEVDVYERSPAELEQRGAGIGFLPATARYLVARAGIALDASASRRPDPVPRAAAARCLRRAHSYRFSSWNTVYRSCWRVSTVPVPPRPRDGRMADAGTPSTSASPTAATARLTCWCAPTGSARSRGRVCCRTRPATAGYVAWRGMVPEASLTRRPARCSTTPSPTTCTPTATSWYTRYPGRMGRSRRANG